MSHQILKPMQPKFSEVNTKNTAPNPPSSSWDRPRSSQELSKFVLAKLAELEAISID